MAYTLLQEIGHGGMGCVYKAKDSNNGKIVAVKMMSNKVTCYPQYRDLFYSEVDTLKRMDHPNVVHIVGEPYGDDEGNLYLPMEYVEGKTIEQCISENGPLPLEKAKKVMCDILDAIQYIHDKRRIHRDLKPSNIMCRPDGSICIIDFGIAKDAKIGSGKTVGRIIGTDGYMSPEQANGLNIDKRTDIYSLGCVFYFILTGKHAVVKGKNDYETVNNILNDIPSLPSEIVKGLSVEIDGIFLKSIDKNMTHRFQSAYEFKESLKIPSCITDHKVSIGRSQDNDIVIDNLDVSRKHLIIRLLDYNYTSSHERCIEIIDNSTNGTGVNGKFLHNAEMKIPFNNENDLPTICLAGKTELLINWNEIIPYFEHSGNWGVGSNDSCQTLSNKCSVSTDVGNIKNENVSLPIYVIILCFVIPFIGFILSIYNWENNKTWALKVLKTSIIGFFVNLLIILIL